MKLSSFEKEMEPQIVQRGGGYFAENAVLNLERITQKDWRAEVQGSDIYNVNIAIKGSEIVAWECDCPYDWGPVCKHVVAVLYAIRESAREARKPTDKQGEKPKKKKKYKIDKLREMMDKIPTDELKQFFLNTMIKNRQLESEFLIQFVDRISAPAQEKYRELITNIVDSGRRDYGRIYGRHLTRVINLLKDLLDKAKMFFNNGNYREGVIICQTMLEEYPMIISGMDNSEEDCYLLLEDTCQCLIASYGLFPRPLKDHVYEFLEKLYSSGKYAETGFEGELLNILELLLDSPDRQDGLLELIDRKLKLVKNDDFEWKTVSLLEKKINILNQFDRQDEARRIVEEYIQYDSFRKIILEEKMAAKQYGEAKKIAEEGLAISKQKSYSGNSFFWQEQLLEIARLNKNKMEIRKLAKQLFESSQWDMQYYRILKQTYSKNEWKEEVEKIIDSFKKISFFGFSHVLAVGNILKAENFPDRLLKLMKANSKHIECINHFADYLKQHYPSEVLNLYREGISVLAKHTGRPVYKEVISYMKKMNTLEDGELAVEKLLKDFRLKYKRRPAMLEMLNTSFKMREKKI